MSTFALQNPSTGQAEEQFNSINDADRDAILDRATAAGEQWRKTSIAQRADVLRKTAKLFQENKKQLAEHVSREVGKLTGGASAEIGIVSDIFSGYADHARASRADDQLSQPGAQQTWVRKVPLGVVLGIMPWNFSYFQV